MPNIIVMDNDQEVVESLSRNLPSTFTMEFCRNLPDLAKRMQKNSFDALVLDLSFGGSEQQSILSQFSDWASLVPAIVTSSEPDPDRIVAMIKAGAVDYFVKPYPMEKLRLALEKALENRSMKNEIDYLRRQQDVVYDFNNIVAYSPKMQELMATVRKYCQTDSTILITGETGTGKSFISGSIHFNSHRRKMPFINISCVNIPETLLESELFGHEKGAFSGADKTRVGRIEQAKGGTVLLDEIGELSPSIQAKILQVVDEKSFVRLGGNRNTYSDIRILAATNRNLEEQIEAGNFREDLFYRLNVLRLHLPALRDRNECIEPLALHFLKKFCRSIGKKIEGFDKPVIHLFRRYSWPGNIRELSNTIERAVLLEEGRTIGTDSVTLTERTRPQPKSLPDVPPSPADSTIPGLDEHEKNLILRALEKNLWIQKDAAAELAISPRALNYKIKLYGITHHRWRKNR